MTDTNQKQLGNTLWSIADPLHGVKDTQFDIFHGDTLLNEWEMMREQNPAKKPSFDAIVANPPFSYRWEPSMSSNQFGEGDIRDRAALEKNFREKFENLYRQRQAAHLLQGLHAV